MRFRKILVVGLDGLEPSILERLMDAGELPNFAHLREVGCFTRVATTTPAQTPVAWSTFSTGLNPGGHGIFDFIRRDPRTYLPDLGLNRHEQKNPFVPPRAVNSRRGEPVWSILSAAGVPSTILRCPCSYPPDPLRGRMLAGMGVPDIRGGLGTSTFATADSRVVPGESENLIRLRVDSDRVVRSHLIGPRNPRDRSDIRFEFELHPGSQPDSAILRSAATPGELNLRVGHWSPWLKVTFKIGLLQSARGMVRVYLRRYNPERDEVELLVSPVNFDPAAPLFPISSPGEYARELENAVETYFTTGMVEDHAGLSNGRLTEAAFLDQCAQVWDEREAMMLHELDRFEEGLFFCLFDTSDRVQHMFWRYLEPDHPANRDHPVDPSLHSAVDDQYRRADAVVGRAHEFVDDQTLLLVLSDHGFNSFRRGVDLNAWLHQQGLLALRPDIKPGESAGDLLQGVDWSRTSAYALGLGGIYLNLKGREAQGIVEPEEADNLSAWIARGLAGLPDPEQGGAIAVRRVSPRAEIYHGPFAMESPDLVVQFNAGYRVGWSTSLGGIAARVFEDNTKLWAGDHIIDPRLVPGALFSHHPLYLGGSGRGPGLVDLAPTILAGLGVPVPPAMEGSPLR